MNCQYKLVIAQLKILIISEVPLMFQQEHQIFLRGFDEPEDIRYLIRMSKARESSRDTNSCYTGMTYKVYNTHNGYVRVFDLVDEKLVLHQDVQKKTQFIIDIEAEETDFLRKLEIEYYLALEVPFLFYHAFWLHASLVKWKEKGVVFTAPSGTGKSTQAELWQRHLGAEVLNGDRTLLRFHDGQWRGHGSIYAGSSHIFSNDSTEVHMLIILEQGEKNTLTRLKPAEAFSEIYRGILTNPWDAEFTNAAIGEIMDLLVSIPVYRFQCRPDRDAVEVVRRELERLESGENAGDEKEEKIER